MIFKNNKVYDELKKWDMVILPAIAALYVGLAKVWGLPYATQLSETINYICLFLGALLGISNAEYYRVLHESGDASKYYEFDEELEPKEDEGEG